MLSTNAVPYLTYGPLLDALRREAMSLTLRVAQEATDAMGRPVDPRPAPPLIPTAAALRAMAVLPAVVQQAGRVARYIDTLPRLIEERHGGIMHKLDLVFGVFARHRVELATYDTWLVANLANDLDAEAAEVSHDDGQPLPTLYADMTGRRPMVLVAELCRDFGIATHTFPAEWLDPVSPDLRLLCARAAAASLRPARLRGPVRSSGKVSV